MQDSEPGRNRSTRCTCSNTKPRSEGQAVRAMASVCLMAACLGLVGCKSFGKKSKDQANTPVQQPADTAWPGSAAAPGSGSTGRSGATELNGFLAGRVLDSYDHRPPLTYI